jgi:hypothetical protein
MAVEIINSISFPMTNFLFFINMFGTLVNNDSLRTKVGASHIVFALFIALFLPPSLLKYNAIDYIATDF